MCLWSLSCDGSDGPVSDELASHATCSPGTLPPNSFLGQEVELSTSDVVFFSEGGGLSGVSVDFLGDIDGDGYDDIGIADRDYQRPDGGEVGGYQIVYGRPGLRGEFSLDNAEASFALQSYTPITHWIQGVGDVNGDGFDDFAISGATVILGGPERYDGFYDAWTAGTNLWSLSEGIPGIPLAGRCDLDGDGFDDIVFATLPERNGDFDEVSIFYGGSDRFGPAVASLAPDATLISGIPDIEPFPNGRDDNRHFGRALSCSGDVDNDGFDDLIIGAPTARDDYPGDDAVFLLYGSSVRLTGHTALTEIGFAHETTGRSSFGWSVAIVEDVNGDGFDEVAIGDTHVDPNQVFLFYGGRERPTGVRDATTADFILSGDVLDVNLGHSLGSGGDVNCDGYHDLLISSPNSPDPTQAGYEYLFLGGPDRLNGFLDVGVFDVRYHGAVDEINGTDRAGYSLSIRGDFNGDGYSDILVGAYGNIIGDEYGGRTYLVYGPP